MIEMNHLTVIQTKKYLVFSKGFRKLIQFSREKKLYCPIQENYLHSVCVLLVIDLSVKARLRLNSFPQFVLSTSLILWR